MSTADPIPAIARAAANQVTRVSRQDWRSVLARSGLLAKGILYGTLGVLALKVAAGRGTTGRTNPRGAIELIARQPLGEWLLALLTAGLVALAVWQVILAFTGDPVDGGSATDRAIYAGKAFIYFGTAATAASLLGISFGIGAAAGSEASQDHTTAVVMNWPGGRWLVGLAGAAVIAGAIYQFRTHAINSHFMRRLSLASLSRHVVSTIQRAGRIGYAVRALVLFIMGLFFIVAALQHDPREAVGFSGALQAAAQRDQGQALIWLIGIGLIGYGSFCFVEARYRRST